MGWNLEPQGRYQKIGAWVRVGGNSQGKNNREIPGGVSEGEVFRNEGGGVRKERTGRNEKGSDKENSPRKHGHGQLFRHWSWSTVCTGLEHSEI